MRLRGTSHPSSLGSPAPLPPRRNPSILEWLGASTLVIAVLAVVALNGSGEVSRASAVSPDDSIGPAYGVEQRWPQEARNILQPESSKERPVGGRVLLPQNVERTAVSFDNQGRALLRSIPKFNSAIGENVVGLSQPGEVVFFTIDQDLQRFAEELVNNIRASHVAVAVMDPRTGAVLALADKSVSIPNLVLHSGFPAASLFKVVTAAAAVEGGGLSPNHLVTYRGGTYALDQWNYRPDPRRDLRIMSIAEALGRSCNPVFGRLALKFLPPSTLNRYANAFGFNRHISSDIAIPLSSASIPRDDGYEYSRTGAGFGAVNISPIHAAAMMSGIANGGLMPQPRLIDKVVTEDGRIKYTSTPQYLGRMMSSSTAAQLMEMMEHTTTNGTSRKEFMYRGQRVFGSTRVAAKTGTLTGTNPRGLNNWFIAAAPIENPKIALAVVVNNGIGGSKASYVGRRLFEKALNITSIKPAYVPVVKTKGRGVKKIVKKKKVVQRVAKPVKRSTKSTKRK